VTIHTQWFALHVWEYFKQGLYILYVWLSFCYILYSLCAFFYCFVLLIDMSLHTDTFSWFRANQYLLFLLNDVCLAEKQHIPILKCLVWLDRDSNSRSTALEAKQNNKKKHTNFIKYNKKRARHTIYIVQKLTCSHRDIAENMAELALNNNHYIWK
jgi:hypothetical protein